MSADKLSRLIGTVISEYAPPAGRAEAMALILWAVLNEPESTREALTLITEGP